MSSLEQFLEALKQRDELKAKQVLAKEPALASAFSDSGISLVMLSLYYGFDSLAQHIAEISTLPIDVFELSALGRTETLRFLLQSRKAEMNSFAKDGFSPLGLASFFGRVETVKLLLESGAQVNTASANPMMVRPLHSAAARKHLEIAKLLLEAGAEVNCLQQGDVSPLHSAAHNNDKAMVSLLLSYGADVNLVDSSSKKPKDYAKDPEIQSLL